MRNITKKMILMVFLLLMGFASTSLITIQEVENASDASTTIAQSGQVQIGEDYQDGVVLIKYVIPAMSLFQKGEDFSDYGVSKLSKVHMLDETKSSKLSFSESTVWYKAELEDEMTVENAIEAISKLPGVLVVEPDYTRSIEVETPSSNDPMLSEQYYLNQIELDDARTFLESNGVNPGGSRSVIVAVIDTGVDYTHTDLTGNMWVNTGEIPGDGIDNDHNGYIDDIHGASTVGNVSSHSGDPMDTHGHGTHVAGIIAAQGNNEFGIRGIANNVRIMAIRAAGPSGMFNTSDIVEAINYAVENGADVINMSFGGSSPSAMEAEALGIAFNHAVLVAAAGNQGLANEACPLTGMPFYPAAYTYVIGVMASNQSYHLADFSNYDCTSKNSIEYEVVAPGVEILSTLPNDSFAKWSGTSMAAPVVTGVVALLRSYYVDSNIYSTRFIMGQIIGTANIPIYVYDLQTSSWVQRFWQVNAYDALQSSPTPVVNVFNHYIFDSSTIALENNGDGVIDAGETIDLAIVLRNHWGSADDVIVTIDTLSPSNIPDPYVTLIHDTVDYQSVGTFNTKDNGLQFDENQFIVGVDNPFTLQVASDTPNDYHIKLNVHVTYHNGYDALDLTDYQYDTVIELSVRSGVVLPNIVSENLTLDSSSLWIVPNAMLIEEGATVTVEEGTYIQFWSSEPEDVYAETPIAYIIAQGTLLLNGTEENPIHLFPSQLKEYYNVSLSGNVFMNYTEVVNPMISAKQISHSSFTQNGPTIRYRAFSSGEIVEYRTGGFVQATLIEFSIFRGLGAIPGGNEYGSAPFEAYGNLHCNLFDSNYLVVPQYYSTDNVFLNNYKYTGTQWDSKTYYASQIRLRSNYVDFGYATPNPFKEFKIMRMDGSDTTYIGFSLNIDTVWNDDAYIYTAYQLVQRFANSINGHLVDVSSEAEDDFLVDNYQNFVLGMYQGIDSEYYWSSGQDMTYQNFNETLSDHQWNHSYVIDTSNGWIRGGYFDFKFIIEVPDSVLGSGIYEGVSTITEELIQNQITISQASGDFSMFSNNSFLNNLINPDINTWMRIITQDPYNNANYFYMQNNYFGTTSSLLVEKQILDFNDYQSLARVISDPYLLESPESNYPHVNEVYLSTDTEERTSVVGIGTTTFTVTFNREMDQTVPLQVYFGPDIPYTDFQVTGSYVDGYTWQGEFPITFLTGDGKQYLRIFGGRAVGDHWLELGDDDERFSFVISSSSAESMNLQASGAEGRIMLSWMQDDFELLMGFNIYRSESPNGTFVKINSSIVPNDVLSYTDYAVEQGKVYYYKFKVVQTEMIENEFGEMVFKESNFSNLAAAAAFDTLPPTLTHVALDNVSIGNELFISMNATDNVGIIMAKCYYRASGDSEYQSIDMIKGQSSLYTVRLFIDEAYSSGFEYYLEVSDGIISVFSGSHDYPYAVTVFDKPTIYSVASTRGISSGGETVIINGANFKPTTIVYFGNVMAMNITYIDESTLSVTTPNHYPSKVNVTVVNSTGDSAILYNGFEYYSEFAVISVTNTGGMLGQEVSIPVRLDNVTGLLSVDFTFTYDETMLLYLGFTKGNMASRFVTVINDTVDGTLHVAMASDLSVSGNGDILFLRFRVISDSQDTVDLILSNYVLNGGSIQTTSLDGLFQFEEVYSFSGTIRYYSNNEAVSGVAISLIGERTYHQNSFEDGYYIIEAIEKGDYTVDYEKTDGIDAITAYDASLILRYAVGLEMFGTYQVIAGDINQDGSINSFDASMVLQYVAGLRVLPFEGRDNIWYFTNDGALLENISSNLSSQDRIAVLIGDVSGNYSDTTIESIQNIIKIGTIEFNPDEHTITVPISIRELSINLYSLETTLRYDASLLVDSVQFDASLENYLKVVNSNEPGIIKIVFAGVTPLENTENIIRITFMAESFNLEKYYFELNNTLFNEEMNIEEIWNALNLVCSNDFNKDGVFNSDDISYLVGFINTSNQTEDISDYDFNHDGIVDIYDLILSQQSQ